jgi:hypothetical protein
MRQDITPAQVRTARIVAATADLLQIVLLPAFFPGWASPAADVTDVVVALVMYGLLGWHWAFLPTFAIELVPFVDLVPTWTAAVFLVTRSRAVPETAPGAPVVVEPPPREEPRALPAGRQTPPGSEGS